MYHHSILQYHHQNDPRYAINCFPFHHVTNPLQVRHLGTITTVNTTPPSVTIRPSDGSHAITSLALTQNQLKIFLNNLAAGAAQVSYTVYHYLYGNFAADVQCTLVVDSDSTRGVASRQDQLELVAIVPSQRRVRRRRVASSGASVRHGWRRPSWGTSTHGI